MEELLLENKKLKEELFFFNKIFKFYDSLVYNMIIKYKNGEKVWIDKQKITERELLELDEDDEVKNLIKSCNTKYNDSDW
tara:strand:- start:1968 stop:2207 length:240 start_codon:yes stop_codon:yes gene_type:complete